MSATEDETQHIRLPVEIQDLVFAGKLTINAGWLYGLLLRHINYKRGDTHVWPSRSNLAKRMQFKNARAVDRYLDELADACLIEKERRRNGEVNDSNRYTLLLVSWPKNLAPEGGSAPQPTTPGALEHTTLVRHSAPELDEPQLDPWELDPGTEQNSTTSSRCAPSGGDVAQGDAQNTEDEASDNEEPTGNFWLNDRDAFRRIMGSRIVAEGSEGWPRGVYDVDRIYSELRVRKVRRIPRPGRYVSSLLVKEDGRALENWLLREGFETPDGALG